ncbi:MAG: hypothetical protein QM504_03025 [Pseudomonadota bacterium]
MRRAIKVFGAQLEDGNKVTTDDDGIVSVTVHPDKSVTFLTPEGDTMAVNGKWTSYVPRFN